MVEKTRRDRSVQLHNHVSLQREACPDRGSLGLIRSSAGQYRILRRRVPSLPRRDAWPLKSERLHCPRQYTGRSKKHPLLPKMICTLLFVVRCQY